MDALRVLSVLSPFVPCNAQACRVAGIICAKQCDAVNVHWCGITCSTEIQPIAATEMSCFFTQLLMVILIPAASIWLFSMSLCHLRFLWLFLAYVGRGSSSVTLEAIWFTWQRTNCILWWSVQTN